MTLSTGAFVIATIALIFSVTTNMFSKMIERRVLHELQ